MPQVSSHRALGVGLASAAFLAGAVALGLGWFTPGELPRAGPPAPASFALPVTVRVSVLP